MAKSIAPAAWKLRPQPQHLPMALPWLVELDAVDSTNAWALARLRELAPGCAVIAVHQTAGRGRDGRTWTAPPGSLAASIVVAVPVALSGAMALAAGLAVIHAAEDLLPGVNGALRLKWPNDVRTATGKLAGILCEGTGEVLGRLVVGVGCNLRNSVAGISGASSLIELSPHAPEPLIFLTRLRDYLIEAAALLSARGLGPLLGSMRARDALLGVALTVELRDRTIVGHGAGIDELGRLLVMTHGGVVAVDAGHVALG